MLDKTGLGGYYDFTLEFTAMVAEGAPPVVGGQGVGDNASEPGPNLDAALQQQLGLRLVHEPHPNKTTPHTTKTPPPPPKPPHNPPPNSTLVPGSKAKLDVIVIDKADKVPTAN